MSSEAAKKQTGAALVPVPDACDDTEAMRCEKGTIPRQLTEVLADLRRAFQTRYGPRLRGLYLYGSWARGDSSNASDVDMLVVLAGAVDPLVEIGQYSDIIADLSLKYNRMVSTVPVSEDWFVNRHTPFLDNVRRDAMAV